MKDIIEQGPKSMKAALSSHDHALVSIVAHLVSTITMLYLEGHEGALRLAWPTGAQSCVEAMTGVVQGLPPTAFCQPFVESLLQCVKELSTGTILLPISQRVDLYIALLKGLTICVGEWRRDVIIADGIDTNEFPISTWMEGMEALQRCYDCDEDSSSEWHRVVPFLVKSFLPACDILSTAPITDQGAMDRLYLLCLGLPLKVLSGLVSSPEWLLRCTLKTLRLIAILQERQKRWDSSTSKGNSPRPLIPTDCFGIISHVAVAMRMPQYIRFGERASYPLSRDICIWGGVVLHSVLLRYVIHCPYPYL